MDGASVSLSLTCLSVCLSVCLSRFISINFVVTIRCYYLLLLLFLRFYYQSRLYFQNNDVGTEKLRSGTGITAQGGQMPTVLCAQYAHNVIIGQGVTP